MSDANILGLELIPGKVKKRNYIVLRFDDNPLEEIMGYVAHAKKNWCFVRCDRHSKKGHSYVFSPGVGRWLQKPEEKDNFKSPRMVRIYASQIRSLPESLRKRL